MKKVRNSFLFLFLVIFVSCQQPSTTRTVVHSAPKPGDFKIIGYLPGRSVDTTAIAFNRLTHINFAFAIPAKNGGGLDAVRNADKLAALVKKAHRHDVKVFISIGGWSIGDGGGDDSRFHRLAADPQERNYFVTKTMELVRRFDLDGVD